METPNTLFRKSSFITSSLGDIARKNDGIPMLNDPTNVSCIGIIGNGFTNNANIMDKIIK